jgi:UDP-2-acetamido-2,6-beta-L-arabino-hexul-4-ose reductase
MPVEFDELSLHSDARGVVFEPLELEQIVLQRNTHVVISKPGVVRGNHYHLLGTEIMAVMGPARVRFKEDEEIRDIDIPAEKVYRFTFPPHVPHAIKNLGKQPNILIAFNTSVHDPENPDTVEETLIETKEA